ncbi:MAG: pyridoxal phosphate-dependent aminotransferase [Alphaproteobacteria bacterium]
MKVQERMHGLPRIGLDIMGDLADERTGAYRLENADSDIPPPAVAVEATRRAVGRDEYNSWLPLVGLRELRQAVARRIKTDSGLEYDWASEVIITNGAQEGLLSTLLALIGPGDGVITPEPAYSGIINRIRLAHGVPQFVPLVERRRWALDLEALARRAYRTTRAMVINPTNMPTGKVFTREEMDGIAYIALERDLWLIDDQPSRYMVFDGAQVHDIASRPGMRERTIMVGSVSKDFNLTGWRIGWVVGPAAAIEHVGKAHMYNGTLTSAFAQAGVAAFLDDDRAFREDVRNRVRILEERARVAAAGLALIEGLSCVPAQGGWWFLLDHRKVEPDAERFARHLLETANVAVTPMTTWGPSTAMGHVRIIFSNEPVGRLREAVGAIGAAVETLRR